VGKGAKAAKEGVGFRKQAEGCGCGMVAVLSTGIPLLLVCLGLGWLGVPLPTPGDPTEAGASVPGALIVNTVVALLAAAVAVMLVFLLAMAHDSVHGDAPRRAAAVHLCYVLPVLALAAVAGGWICYALGDGTAARYLGLGPWAAVIGMIGATAVVLSGATAYTRTSSR
jgi:hypothetical protein